MIFLDDNERRRRTFRLLSRPIKCHACGSTDAAEGEFIHVQITHTGAPQVTGIDAYLCSPPCRAAFYTIMQRTAIEACKREGLEASLQQLMKRVRRAVNAPECAL